MAMSNNTGSYGPGRIVRGINNTSNLLKKVVLRQPDIKLPLIKVLHQVSTIDKIDWGLQLLGIPEWWKVTKGEGIKIAVLDTGSSNHQDLKPNIVEAVNFSASKTVEDMNGHSTHICGIIAGIDNGVGIVGISPRSELYIGKVLNDNGSGDYKAICNGINWAVNKVKADIISMSLGGNIDDRNLRAAVDLAYRSNVIMVCAAGNSGSYRSNTINYPGKYDQVICVGSIDKNMKRSNFSSVGSELDIMAPGGNIYSCYLNNSYALLSGSSMATPFITSVLALAMSKERKAAIGTVKTPIRNVADAKEHLIRCAMKPQDYDKNKYGFGIVNPKQMLLEPLSIIKTGN